MGCELYSPHVVAFASTEGYLLASRLALARTRQPKAQAQNKVHHLIIRYTSHVKKEKATSE